MRNKDTGEFELVVGDKQLLSGFFIGLVLLGVVFAMGYVMGRGTHQSAGPTPDVAAVTPNAAADSHPAANAPVPASPEPVAAAPASTPADSPTTAAPPVEPPPQPTTVPARDTTAAAPPPAAEPANASYWQVTAAASKTSADAMTQTLLNKGFPATSRPGPNNLTVVWVGPYTDKASLTRAKKQLEDVGLNPIKKP